jgi:adenylate cyclase
LREYLSTLSNVIMDEKWFINKYEGDAIMALWWVFGNDEKASYSACESALRQQEILKELNKDWGNRGFPPIKVRMWMHVWDAIIGNIGAVGRKMEFTALWDNVNLASRLEGVNKFYGTYMCVSEAIYQEVKEYFVFRYLDKIRVKWKNIWVEKCLLFKWWKEKWKRLYYSKQHVWLN